MSVLFPSASQQLGEGLNATLLVSGSSAPGQGLWTQGALSEGYGLADSGPVCPQEPFRAALTEIRRESLNVEPAVWSILSLCPSCLQTAGSLLREGSQGAAEQRRSSEKDSQSSLYTCSLSEGS